MVDLRSAKGDVLDVAIRKLLDEMQSILDNEGKTAKGTEKIRLLKIKYDNIRSIQDLRSTQSNDPFSSHKQNTLDERR